MDYEKLTVEQQREMLNGRLAQYEQEHYNHSVNLKLLEASGQSDEGAEKAKAEAREAMAILDEAHANAKAELDGLSAST